MYKATIGETALLLVGMLLVAGAALAQDPAPEPGQCVLQSSEFYARAGAPAPAAPNGVGQVWIGDHVLWTIASDYAGVSAAERAQQIAEWRLVPWTAEERTCVRKQIHVGMYGGNWVIYRAAAEPFLPTPENIIVTVDPATAAYHGDTPGHLAYYWRYRLASFLHARVPEQQLPPKMAEVAVPMSSANYVPEMCMGNMGCGHCKACGCGVGAAPDLYGQCATCAAGPGPVGP